MKNLPINDMTFIDLDVVIRRHLAPAVFGRARQLAPALGYSRSNYLSNAVCADMTEGSLSAARFFKLQALDGDFSHTARILGFAGRGMHDLPSFEPVDPEEYRRFLLEQWQTLGALSKRMEKALSAKSDGGENITPGEWRAISPLAARIQSIASHFIHESYRAHKKREKGSRS